MNSISTLLFFGVWVFLWLVGTSSGLSISQTSPPLVDATLHDSRVCVYAIGDTEFQSEAKQLASDLSIPSITSLEDLDHFSHALRLVNFDCSNVSTYALALQSLTPQSTGKSKQRKQKQKQKPSANPYFIDFCPLKGGRGAGPDLLVKAVAPGKKSSSGADGCVVYDLTAGFGQDSLVLALNGASKVHMVERDPVISAMLSDALRRVDLLASDATFELKDLAESISGKLDLTIGEGHEALSQLNGLGNATMPPDVVYLDPMFPPRTKSAAVKKDMQLLHGLLDTQVSDDTSLLERQFEEQRLLQAAYDSTGLRVVVKRPIRAPTLGGEEYTKVLRPSYSVDGSINRWDVYLKN